MSADCIYILRNVENVGLLQRAIILITERLGYGVWLCPQNALLIFRSIIVGKSDFCFSPTDAPDTINVDLLISHENHYINGKCAKQSLRDRLFFLQELAGECIQYADSIEIYISEDNPYLPEYSSYEVYCDSVAETLLSEYQKNIEPAHIIPSIRLLITKNKTKL